MRLYYLNKAKAHRLSFLGTDNSRNYRCRLCQPCASVQATYHSEVAFVSSLQ